jgi:PAS domain S-box-containing protein
MSGSLRIWWLRTLEQFGNALTLSRYARARRADALEKSNAHLKAVQSDSQRRWQLLVEAQRLSHAGTFVWNVAEGELLWSDETYRIFGFSRETVPTLDLVFGRVHPEERDYLQQLAEDVAQSGTDIDVEQRVLLPDGVIRHLHTVAHAGRNDKGQLEYAGVVTDVSERKFAEEERRVLSRKLEESNALLEEAQRVANVGHWMWDLTTNLIVFSAENYRTFGLPPQEGPTSLEEIELLIHPDDREVVLRTASEAIRTGTRAVCEHRLFRPNGEMRVVRSLGDLRFDAEGRPYQMFGTTQDITDSRRAEEERQALARDLQESKSKLEEAQRVAHVGYWEWNLDTNDNFWSDETYRIYGLEPQKGPIDIALISEMIHPEDREAVFRTAQEAVRDGRRPDAEHRIIRPTGEVRTVHSLGDLRMDEAGRPYGMFGTVQDITERKRAEATLQQIQRYLRAGEGLAHIGSWAWTRPGLEWTDDMEMDLYWSEEIFNIYGLDPADGPPTLEQCVAACHPQDRTFFSETVKRMHAEHGGCDFTHRIVRPNGEVRYVRCVGVPVSEGGLLTGIQGTTMDVTEHELLTRQLRREQTYLAEAQSLTHTGSWATNLVTREIYHSSDENARLYGLDPSQGPIPFEQFYSRILPEDEAAIRAKLEHAIGNGLDYDVEFRVRRTDGAIRVLRGIGHHHPSQELGDYFGITADVTDRKHAETERQRLQQLEAEIARVNRVNMMGELAAALAHEIKQPIAASITSANALLRWLAHVPPDLERARATAARIEQDANRAASVIDSLRSFYSTGKPADRETLDVKEVVREMTGLLTREAERHAIVIRAELSADTPRILANPVQLRQVFMNLMLNAIEAMKESGGELLIRSGSNPEGQLLVAISDTGTGLSAESVDKIFEPLHTTKPQGTGMGLTITRSIVESYGGRVWAASNPDRGATFHVTLPLK